jgi:hypothetical protein
MNSATAVGGDSSKFMQRRVTFFYVRPLEKPQSILCDLATWKWMAIPYRFTLPKIDWGFLEINNLYGLVL